MIPFDLIILVLILHFIGDFLFQSDWMAVNKSTNNKALLSHVFVYSIMFFFVLPWQWVVVNVLLHLMTDYITSRIASRFYKLGKRGAFFNTIGIDQCIHLVTMILTLPLFI